MVWAITDNGQECIGVFENEFDASRFLDEFNARRKHNEFSGNHKWIMNYPQMNLKVALHVWDFMVYFSHGVYQAVR